MIPPHIQRQLIKLADHLPKPNRGGFIRTVAHRLEEVALEHPRTVVFGAAGWVLGSLLGFDEIGLVIGAVVGLSADMKAQTQRSQIARIIHEELKQYAG